MSTVTVRRNGICIVFPERKPATFKDEEPKKAAAKKERISPVAIKVKPVARVAKKSIVLTNGKCMRCGSNCWRADVNYCWDCYKYEKFESR